jgi:8-oxo-dGTP diphosphatase
LNANKVVHAAVAVLMREDGMVLLGNRPAGKAWAGWWEFPGGKIEVGETPVQALQRELAEELGVQATEAYPWLVRTFDYPEKTVKLNFFIVKSWQGEPVGREAQQLSWQNPSGLTVEPMLPANTPILSALSLPPVYAITNMHEMGEAPFFKALKLQLGKGLKLIQVREKQLGSDALIAFSQKVIALARPFGARVLMNAEIDEVLKAGADGLHLNSIALMALSEKPHGLLVAASCHNTQEMAKAAQLNLDFVMLSPVLPTRSHPEAQGLGWENFSEIKQDYPLPVYALGGMQSSELKNAWQAGAHGIAMQRAVWE